MFFAQKNFQINVSISLFLSSFLVNRVHWNNWIVRFHLIQNANAPRLTQKFVSFFLGSSFC